MATRRHFPIYSTEAVKKTIEDPSLPFTDQLAFDYEQSNGRGRETTRKLQQAHLVPEPGGIQQAKAPKRKRESSVAEVSRIVAGSGKKAKLHDSYQEPPTEDFQPAVQRWLDEVDDEYEEMGEALEHGDHEVDQIYGIQGAEAFFKAYNVNTRPDLDLNDKDVCDRIRRGLCTSKHPEAGAGPPDWVIQLARRQLQFHGPPSRCTDMMAWKTWVYHQSNGTKLPQVFVPTLEMRVREKERQLLDKIVALDAKAPQRKKATVFLKNSARRHELAWPTTTRKDKKDDVVPRPFRDKPQSPM